MRDGVKASHKSIHHPHAVFPFELQIETLLLQNGELQGQEEINAESTHDNKHDDKKRPWTEDTWRRDKTR